MHRANNFTLNRNYAEKSGKEADRIICNSVADIGYILGLLAKENTGFSVYMNIYYIYLHNKGIIFTSPPNRGKITQQYKHLFLN